MLIILRCERSDIFALEWNYIGKNHLPISNGTELCFLFFVRLNK